MKQSKWTPETLRKGFDDFFNLHGRYPTALEVDSFPSLPSSRQIQRIFGGLKFLKRSLGLPNGTIKQPEIDKWFQNRKKVNNPIMKVLSFEEFRKFLKTLKPITMSKMDKHVV